MEKIDRAYLNELMNRVSIGDRRAIDPLLEALRPIVYRFSSRLLNSPYDAEDVTQLVLINVFSRSSEFFQGSDVLSWVFGITAYECKTQLKRKLRNREGFVDDNVILKIKSTSDSESELIDIQLRQLMREMVQELAEVDRVTILASIEEVLCPEVAPATYRKRLERAITRLRQAWNNKHEI